MKEGESSDSEPSKMAVVIVCTILSIGLRLDDDDDGYKVHGQKFCHKRQNVSRTNCQGQNVSGKIAKDQIPRDPN